jgi:magnesium transporter
MAPRAARKPHKNTGIRPDSLDNIGSLGLTDELYVTILNTLDTRPQRLKEMLAPLHPADLADLMERLPRGRRKDMLGYIPEERLGEMIAELEPGAKEHVLNVIHPEDVRDALEELESDDAAYVARSVEAAAPEFEAESLLTDYQQKRLLDYDPDTAGGLMQLEVLTARPSQTLGEVLAFIRANEEDLPDRAGTVFVVNGQRKLQGTVSLDRLVRLPPEAILGDVMRHEPLRITPHRPLSEVVKLFEKYDVHNLAVVNRRGQLLGRITIDDVLDTVISQAANAQARTVGLSDDEDLFAPVLTTTKHRLWWLLVNLGTAVLAAAVIAMFQDSIAKFTLLAVLMPIVASMGGNATTQTQTVIIRGMALGQVTPQNRFLLLTRELLANVNVGLCLAALLAAGVALLYGQPKLALVIALATVANHVIAAVGGWVTPLVLKRFGFDPAIATTVITTTFTDVGGFFSFLALATWLLM